SAPGASLERVTRSPWSMPSESTPRMLAALTLRPAADVSTMGTDACAAACENRAAGRACNPTLDATTTVRSGIGALLSAPHPSGGPDVFRLVCGSVPVGASPELHIQRHGEL